MNNPDVQYAGYEAIHLNSISCRKPAADLGCCFFRCRLHASRCDNPKKEREHGRSADWLPTCEMSTSAQAEGIQAFKHADLLKGREVAQVHSTVILLADAEGALQLLWRARDASHRLVISQSFIRDFLKGLTGRSQGITGTALLGILWQDHELRWRVIS